MRIRRRRSRSAQVADVLGSYLKLKAASKAAKGARKAAKGIAAFVAARVLRGHDQDPAAA